MKSYYKEYDFGHGITVRPRLELDGIVKAGPDWDCEPCYVKVFDVFQNCKLKATAERWEEAKDMAFNLRLKNR